MNEQFQIPSDIALIIEQKRAAIQEETRQEKEAEKRKQEEWQVQGQIKFNEYIAETILQVPEWIRPYLDMPDVDYERLGKGWDQVGGYDLFFAVPGLARIHFDPRKKEWRSACAHWHQGWDVDDEPVLRFHNSYSYSDIEYVLHVAEAEMAQHQENLEQYISKQNERAKRAEQSLQEQAEREAQDSVTAIRNELKQAEEKAEEQVLLDTLKSDPVAIAMLKAFVMIHQERGTLEAQIEDANNSLYSMEEHWSRRAVELQHQADEAKRHAEEERFRIQSDLDDAESKLKKAQHAQRGW